MYILGKTNGGDTFVSLNDAELSSLDFLRNALAARLGNYAVSPSPQSKTMEPDYYQPVFDLVYKIGVIIAGQQMAGRDARFGLKVEYDVNLEIEPRVPDSSPLIVANRVTFQLDSAPPPIDEKMLAKAEERMSTLRGRVVFRGLGPAVAAVPEKMESPKEKGDRDT